MHIERQTINLTTDGSGDVTAYSEAVTGRVLGVIYEKVDFANGVDFTITGEKHAQPILTLTDQNAAAGFRPRPPVQDEVGADATSDGTRKLREPVYLCQDRVKVVVASGGASKTGKIHVLIG